MIQLLNLVRHHVQQGLSVAAKIGADGISDVVRPLPVQRDADRVVDVFVVRWDMTGATVPLVQDGALGSKLCVTRLEKYSAAAETSDSVNEATVSHMRGSLRHCRAPSI